MYASAPLAHHQASPSVPTCGMSLFSTLAHHKLGPGSFQVVDPGHGLRAELGPPQLRLRRRPAGGLLDVGLGLALRLDLFPQGLQVGLQVAELAQEGGAVALLRVSQTLRVVQLQTELENKGELLEKEKNVQLSLSLISLDLVSSSILPNPGVFDLR